MADGARMRAVLERDAWDPLAWSAYADELEESGQCGVNARMTAIMVASLTSAAIRNLRYHIKPHQGFKTASEFLMNEATVSYGTWVDYSQGFAGHTTVVLRFGNTVYVDEVNVHGHNTVHEAYGYDSIHHLIDFARRWAE